MVVGRTLRIEESKHEEVGLNHESCPWNSFYWDDEWDTEKYQDRFCCDSI